jgi:dTDP-glucose pyrophosphorylase/CBS domain-containing protein
MTIPKKSAKKILPLAIVSPTMPISECFSALDKAGIGVLAVCDEQNILLGIVTDGDIRRALMQKRSLDEPCITIAGKNPLTAPDGISSADALYLMNHGKPFLVHHLPLVDKDGRLMDLLLRSDLQSIDSPSVRAVVMAGGFGIRLRPLTDDTPKPMLLLGDRPVMEHIIDQLRDAGISKVNVTTHYLSEMIRSHFGNGDDFGVSIDYVEEDSPLGTAGSLSLVKAGDEPLLVINGDILSKVDFRTMVTYHREHGADLTVGVRQYGLKVPYGVLDCNDMLVTAVREKPTVSFFVNAGIYLLEPHVHAMIPNDIRYDMTDLMDHLIKTGKRVVSFPIIEYWMDIGQISDYEKANADMVNGMKGR